MGAWLNRYFSAVVRFAGINLPLRGVLEFAGDGVDVVDDVASGTTIVTITGGGGGGDPSTSAPIANASTGTLSNIVSTSLGLPTTAIRCSGAAPVVTGIASGTAGRRLVLHATGGPLVLVNESTSSDAANRFITGTGANLTLGNGHSVELVYDGTSQRWRVAGVSGVSGSASISVSADGKYLELNKHLGPVATSGVVRVAGGGVGGDGFDVRMSGVAPDGTTPVDVGLFYGYTRDDGGTIGIQNVVGFGTWSNDENKSPDLIEAKFKTTLAFSFAKETPQESWTGMSLGAWNVASGDAVIAGFNQRRALTLHRHTNLALFGVRNVALDQEDILGRGEGVVYIGNAETAPSTNPTLGSILWCESESNWLKYRKPNGDIVVLSGPGDGTGDFQVRKEDGTFGGPGSLQDDGEGNVVLNGGNPQFLEVRYVRHTPELHSEKREAFFSGDVTNTTMPKVLDGASIPVLAGDHSGVIELTAIASFYSEGMGSSLQKLLCTYTYYGGVLTLGTTVDLTPTGAVYPSSSTYPSGCTAGFTTHDASGVDFIDVRFRANGDTRWSGTLTVTMTEKPA